ncbi:MAG: M15 family metallopeptidase [Bacteroidetes bacterium]|nr:M15 family metallopeptidase [Bacteroidota bacterium]MBU1719432.1 M15 family metallopeptidase [Bacteroidota bacterium]
MKILKMIEIKGLAALFVTVIACSSHTAETSVATSDKVVIEVAPEDSVPKPEFPAWMTVEFLTGKINYAKDTLFTEVPVQYASARGKFILKETLTAFIKMEEAAKKDGIKLTILSSCRNFDYQKNIWEAKWTGKRIVEGKNLSTAVKDPVERARIILRFSSMPGTSRHHWGTDIDMNSLLNSYFEKGEGLKMYEWLTKNAATYGFCQVYSPIDSISRSTGYQEEKWHWSYMPISELLLQAYTEKVGYEQLTGFAGCEAAESLGVIEKYVGGINDKCGN